MTNYGTKALKIGIFENNNSSNNTNGYFDKSNNNTNGYFNDFNNNSNNNTNSYFDDSNNNTAYLDNNSYCSIMKEKRKENTNMSLVGLLVCKDGIVGVGDYKSSKTLYGGIKYKEKNRKAQKVFANNKFIMATTGVNIIDKDEEREKLEDFINRTLTDNMDYKYFFNNFINHANNADYNFIVGTKLPSGEYALYEIKCLKGEIKEYPLFSNPLFAGDSSYYNVLSFLPVDYSNMSVEEAKIKLENIFIKLIDLMNESTEYRSVGLEGESKPLALIFK